MGTSAKTSRTVRHTSASLGIVTISSTQRYTASTPTKPIDFYTNIDQSSGEISCGANVEPAGIELRENSTALQLNINNNNSLEGAYNLNTLNPLKSTFSFTYTYTNNLGYATDTSIEVNQWFVFGFALVPLCKPAYTMVKGITIIGQALAMI